MELTVLMKSFVLVADMGSFSAASLRLPTSQSNLSKHIAALERHLGVRLFHRTTRSLALTSEGTVFYESALMALAAIDEAEASVSGRSDPSGVLRITMPLTLGESRVIEMISRFLIEHPKIEVDLKLSDHPMNLVADNLDLAIRVGQLNDSSLTARKIGTIRRVIVGSPKYFERNVRPQKPSDLTDHNCLFYSLLSTGKRWSFADGTAVTLDGNFSADSPNALRTGALAGIGLALSARWLFERDIQSGRLEILLPDFEPIPMPINIVLPSGRYVAARVRAFIEFIAQEFSVDPLLAIK